MGTTTTSAPRNKASYRAGLTGPAVTLAEADRSCSAVRFGAAMATGVAINAEARSIRSQSRSELPPAKTPPPVLRAATSSSSLSVQDHNTLCTRAGSTPQVRGNVPTSNSVRTP